MALLKPFIFRLGDNGVGPDLVRQIFLERGWFEFDEETNQEHEWNIWWKTSRFRTSEYDQILPWQRLNHYPKATALTRKDCLARTLKRMKGVYGPNIFNFSPVSYNLPNDYTKFVAEYSKNKQNGNADKALFWICKPVDLSRGRGIFIFRDLSDMQYDCNAVAQKYITNPLLVAGYKFDLRIYVCVTSFLPLNIYIYDDGLARFSTEKFDLGMLGNMFSHLTNTSINKFSPAYTVDKERVGPGCKWTLTQLRHYFHQGHIDDQPIWAKIVNMIILTLLAQLPQVPKLSNCFELYGFDVLIDENLKPWLLEVNFSPALGADCQADVTVKKPMLHDLVDMLNFKNSDAEHGGTDFRGWKINKAYGSNQQGVLIGSAQRPTSKEQKKRGKLPSINLNNSCNSFGSSNAIEEEGCDKMVVDEFAIPSVLPGCGLPSVQHPEIAATQKRPSSVSGRSSASSDHSNQGRKVQAVSNIGSSEPVRSKGTKPVDSKSSLHKSEGGNNLQTITEGMTVTGDVFRDLNDNDLHLIRDNTKSSLYSDSTGSSQDALSVFSDSLEKQAQTIEARRKLIAREKQAQREIRKQHFSTLEQFKIDGKARQRRSSDTDISDKSPKPPRQPVPSSAHPRSPAKPKSLPVRSGTSQHQSNNRLSQPKNRASNAHISLLQGTGYKTSSEYTPQRKGTIGSLPARVGNFYLVYPFNEITRRLGTNPDIRTAIRETAQHLKQTLANLAKRKKNGNAWSDEDGDRLWAPVKPPEEKATQ